MTKAKACLLAGERVRDGAVPGYAFSPAMKTAHLVWDDQSLNKFLQDPAGLVHGTRMRARVPDDATRRRLVGYLQTLK
jgi:cytochrome c